jgi:hypothetical protein
MPDDNNNSLSECKMILTEDEYDILFSCFTLGYGILSTNKEDNEKSINVVTKYLSSLFGDRRDSFDIAFNNLRDKFIKQNEVYQDELNQLNDQLNDS